MNARRYFNVALSLGVLACATEDPTASSGAPIVTQPGAPQESPPPGAGDPMDGAPGGVTGGTGGVQVPPVTTGPVNPGGVPGGTGVCSVKTVESGRVTPDLLIVLDRSGSMRMGGVNRWDPSVDALKTLTSSLGSTIHFGLMAYPGPDMAPPPEDCSVLPFLDRLACEQRARAPRATCNAGSVDVPLAPNNGAAIATALDGMQPDGATPTAATLKAAHTALGSGITGLDETVRPKYVLLVTDGAPNCSTASSTGQSWDAAAVTQSVSEIDTMAKDGIKTYVIGYGTKSDQRLSGALDMMAAAGGTGDQQHRSIEDGTGLLNEFQKIAGQVASCEFTLETAVSDPRFVEVKLDNKQINLNDANGWVIAPDKRRITVQGTSCAKLSAPDEKHNLTVRVLCEPVTLQ